MRLTRKQRFTPFNDYVLNFEFDDGKLSPAGTQQCIINRLGQIEDIEDKYNIASTDELEKRLEVLEIIKNKKPVVLMLYLSKDFEFYNSSVYGVAASLNEQEFNLLKEWLGK